jgi:hypothetical protein
MDGVRILRPITPGGSCSRPVPVTNCRTSPGSASGGAEISCTARTATGGKYVTSRWECSAPSPGSVQHALPVRQWSDDVIFFVHTYHLTSAERHQLRARGVRVVDGQVARLAVQDDRLTGVELADGQVIDRAAVFIRPGNTPHGDGLLAGLGCQIDGAGFPSSMPPAGPACPASGRPATSPIHGPRSSPPLAPDPLRQSPSTLTWSKKTPNERSTTWTMATARSPQRCRTRYPRLRRSRGPRP